jgi:hypothetical protein
MHGTARQRIRPAGVRWRFSRRRRFPLCALLGDTASQLPKGRQLGQRLRSVPIPANNRATVDSLRQAGANLLNGWLTPRLGRLCCTHG